MKAERLSRETSLRLVGACLVLAAVVRFTAPVPAPPEVDAAVAQPARPVTGFAFGGRAVVGDGTRLDLGQTIETPVFALVPDAAAAQELIKSSCLADAPRAAGPAAPPAAVADDLPGLYGAPWVARLGSNLVALLNVAVPRDPLQDTAPPMLQVYRHGRGATAAFAATPAVSVYRGSRALLYRVFAGGPVRCIDLVVPNGAGTGIGYVYYPVGRRIFEARGSFAIQH